MCSVKSESENGGGIMEESWYMIIGIILWFCLLMWNVLCIMIFMFKEVIKWLGLLIFELWFYIVIIFVFLVLVVVKLEGGIMLWWIVFIFLFVCDGCVVYFLVIVFIRFCLLGDRCLVVMRMLWSVFVVVLLLIYKIFFC